MLASLISRQFMFKRLLGSNKTHRRWSGDNNLFSHNYLFVTPTQLRCSFSTTIVRYNSMHPLDDPTVESFFIPGAKVFDRYFECPLGNNNNNKKTST